MANIEVALFPFVTAAVDAGFTVYALKNDGPRATGFVYVTLDNDGSFAAIEIPTHSRDGIQLSAPIKPSRDYGSSVGVDYDGTPEGAVKALREVCQSPTVTVRFVAKRGHETPVVPNYGRGVLDKWPGGPERFETLNSEGQA